ncbi:hypothetical protein AAZX31_12G125300 [Glycine max]
MLHYHHGVQIRALHGHEGQIGASRNRRGQIKGTHDSDNLYLIYNYLIIFFMLWCGLWGQIGRAHGAMRRENTELGWRKRERENKGRRELGWRGREVRGRGKKRKKEKIGGGGGY